LANTLPATRRDEREVAIVGVLADGGGVGGQEEWMHDKIKRKETKLDAVIKDLKGKHLPYSPSLRFSMVGKC
jgi:hypothetical protein